ncbi:methylated-DNA--[protein]-cysteine S-methyltransferase [Candidatus Uhrbacteria bacterium]|nr:MAG: methylated-DNA--[protein]-cysteine S-methyltransferase [Candidatus Uhrbacteria bacterium]
MKSALKIAYGIVPSPFGSCLIATLDKKLCKLSFVDNQSKVMNELRRAWPQAELIRDDKAVKPFVAKIFTKSKAKKNVPFVIQGTDFQIKVWKAMMSIPFGKTKSYKDVAKAVGAPYAFRAVGSACGKNPIGVLIPCHRVLASDGSLGGFGWGLKRKQEMLDWEQDS